MSQAVLCVAPEAQQTGLSVQLSASGCVAGPQQRLAGHMLMLVLPVPNLSLHHNNAACPTAQVSNVRSQPLPAALCTHTCSSHCRHAAVPSRQVSDVSEGPSQLCSDACTL